MRGFTPALFTVAKLETSYIVHQPRDGMALDTGGFLFSPEEEWNCVTCKKTHAPGAITCCGSQKDRYHRHPLTRGSSVPYRYKGEDVKGKS